MSASLTVAGVRWFVAPGGPLLPPELLAPPTGGTVKSGQHRTVCRVVRPGLDLFWKRCRLANLRAWFRDLFRGPKARLEYERARALAANEVRACLFGVADHLSEADRERLAGQLFRLEWAGRVQVDADEVMAHQSR